jgi:Mce-associated membrane protein
MTVDEAISTAVDATDATDEAAATVDVPRRFERVIRASLAHWRAVVVVGLLISSAALVTVLYLTQYRIDRQTDTKAVDEVVAAASTGTVALLSYTPDTLEADLASARSNMTGEFLTYYGKFTSDVVAPAVQQKGITATARVARAGMMEIHPDSAKVLIFLNQETVSKERPEPSLTASSVVVGLTKVGGSWLISAFDPV